MHAIPSLVLAAATTALGLGLTALVSSLALGAAERDDVIQRRPPISIDQTDVSGPDLPGDTPAGGTGPTRHPSGALASGDSPRVSATGPWTSPLYPQNGVTLWDRIRGSSQHDRRAFLLGTAIQVHAPATAATPGPRSVLPP